MIIRNYCQNFYVFLKNNSFSKMRTFLNNKSKTFII